MMGCFCLKCVYFKLGMGLSDYEVEDSVNDRISFSYFCGLNIDQVAPDHSTVSRFRTAMTNAGAYEKLFKEINSQLEKHQIIVLTGIIVDASVIDTPLRPKGKTAHKVTQDRSEKKFCRKRISDSVDKDGTWLKKRGKYHFGFKKTSCYR